jgi:hypothetical protein
MGRHTTGIATAEGSRRLDLSYFLKKGFFKPNSEFIGTLSWSNGGNIRIEACINGEDRYLRLKYTCSTYSQEETDYDYKIFLTSIPSNLGRGEVWYFVCPVTGERARKLYSCYNSCIWKSRAAYRNRIYYNSQLSSKLDYYNDKYWHCYKVMEKLQKMQKRKFYKGKKTRLSNRIDYLEAKIERYDYLRWRIFPKSLMKAMLEEE